MGCLMIVFLLLGLAMPVRGQTALPRSMQLGVDADNWSGQTQSSAYENGLRLMKIDFISWHIQPEEEASSGPPSGYCPILPEKPLALSIQYGSG